MGDPNSADSKSVVPFDVVLELASIEASLVTSLAASMATADIVGSMAVRSTFVAEAEAEAGKENPHLHCYSLPYPVLLA